MKDKKILILAAIYCVINMNNNLHAQDFTETIVTKSNQWINPQYIDYDGDSDMDVISASNGGDIAWWENDGSLSFTKHELITTPLTWKHFDVIDLDTDGDLDMVLLELNSIRIYYNDGNDNFSEVNNGSNFNSTNVIAGNFDSDSDIEFITSEGNNNGRLRLWNPQGNGSFSATLIDNIRVFSVGSMLAEDLDSDGDLDIIVSLRIVPSGSNSLFYYINDGNGVFSKQSISYTNGNYLNQIVDYNNDGHKDILVKNAFNCCAIIFVNDGNLNFSELELISGLSALEYTHILDSDNDGDQDIVTVHSAPENYVGLYENDGSNNFSFQIIAPLQQGNFITSLDITSDGSSELLVGAEASNHPVVFESMGSNSYLPIALDDTFVPSAFDIDDIDNDGLNDLVSVSRSKNELVLWKNEGSYIFNKQIIEQNELNIYSAQIIDVNSDGIKDIFVHVYQSFGSGALYLYENDGNLNFTKIELSSVNAESALVADIDLDGDADILYSAGRPRYLRNDGNNNYDIVFISQELNNPPVSEVIDINGDGYLDVKTNEELYYLNDGTSENFSEVFLPVRGSFADLDNDGDMDIVHTEVSTSGTYLAWYINDGAGNFVESILSDPYRGGSLVVRDFDGDGHEDIVTSPLNDFNSEGLIFWKNDGNQSFTKTVIEDVYYLDGGLLYQADLDGDGDVEVLSSNVKFPLTIWNNESNVPLNVETIDDANNVLVYPTIVDEQLIIKTEKSISNVAVYDLQGKAIKIHVNADTIDVSHLSEGMYILRLIFDSEKMKIVRFIKN